MQNDSRQKKELSIKDEIYKNFNRISRCDGSILSTNSKSLFILILSLPEDFTEHNRWGIRITKKCLLKPLGLSNKGSLDKAIEQLVSLGLVQKPMHRYDYSFLKVNSPIMWSPLLKDEFDGLKNLPKKKRGAYKKGDKLEVTNCNFENELEVTNCNFENELEVTNCNFENELEVTNCNFETNPSLLDLNSSDNTFKESKQKPQNDIRDMPIEKGPSGPDFLKKFKEEEEEKKLLKKSKFSLTFSAPIIENSIPEHPKEKTIIYNIKTEEDLNAILMKRGIKRKKFMSWDDQILSIAIYFKMQKDYRSIQFLDDYFKTAPHASGEQFKAPFFSLMKDIQSNKGILQKQIMIVWNDFLESSDRHAYERGNSYQKESFDLAVNTILKDKNKPIQENDTDNDIDNDIDNDDNMAQYDNNDLVDQNHLPRKKKKTLSDSIKDALGVGFVESLGKNI